MSFRYRIRGICNHWSDEPCTRCWEQWRKRPPVPTARVIKSFPEDFKLEHAFDAWDTVKPVSSREELRQLCEKQGVTSHYLRDSIVWPSGPRRWI